MASPNGEWAWNTWKEVHEGLDPPWITKDYVALARIEKHLGENFKPSWLCFLQCQEPFFAGHSPSKMLSDLGRFIRKAEPVSETKTRENPEFVAAVRRNVQLQKQTTARDLTEKTRLSLLIHEKRMMKVDKQAYRDALKELVVDKTRGNYVPMEERTCEKCNGKGHVPVDHVETADGFRRYCSPCQGTGRVRGGDQELQDARDSPKGEDR